MDMTIRHATADDLENLYELSTDVHLASYGELIAPENQRRFFDYYEFTDEHRRRYIERRRRQLADRDWLFLVAYKGETLAGMELSHRLSDGTVEMGGLFVRPGMQGKGIGRMLLNRRFQEVPEGTMFRLEVLTKNVLAKGLYERLDFHTTGISQRTYFGEEMEIMERQTIDEID